MSLVWGGVLWLLILVPLLVGVYILIQRRRRKYAVRYSSLSLVKESLGRGPGFGRHIPAILFVIGVTVMLAAVARPLATITSPSEQGTVILAIDVSGSMATADLQPTRLDAAKSAAGIFVNKQPQNVRIGVVSFSEDSSLIQAPTTDRGQILAAIVRLAPQSATAIGQGILTSLEAIFEPTATPMTGPVDILGNPSQANSPTPLPRGTFAPAAIILISDGQNNSPPNPLDTASQAADRGVRIYTIGIGNDESASNYTKISTVVNLDEATLKAIAKETGAQYFNAVNETDLNNIYGNLGTRIVFEARQTELTVFFTGFAIMIMLTAGIISMLRSSKSL